MKRDMRSSLRPSRACWNTNSPLVVYTNLSPNHSGQRTHSIDRITPHCVVGQLSAESICGCFISPSRQASCNYGIGKDGRVSLCVEEKNRSWCSSSAANDQRAITIECASDLTHPYAMNSAVYTSLIKPNPNQKVESNYLWDDHEAIIDRETWDKAQEILEKRKELAKVGIHKTNREHHFLYGKVFCGECGAPFLRRTLKAAGGFKTQSTYKAWNCRNRQKGKGNER